MCSTIDETHGYVAQNICGVPMSFSAEVPRPYNGNLPGFTSICTQAFDDKKKRKLETKEAKDKNTAHSDYIEKTEGEEQKNKKKKKKRNKKKKQIEGEVEGLPDSVNHASAFQQAAETKVTEKVSDWQNEINKQIKRDKDGLSDSADNDFFDDDF